MCLCRFRARLFYRDVDMKSLLSYLFLFHSFSLTLSLSFFLVPQASDFPDATRALRASIHWRSNFEAEKDKRDPLALAEEKKRTSHDNGRAVVNERIDIEHGSVSPHGGLLAIDAQGRVSLFVVECYMHRFTKPPSPQSIKNRIHNEDLSRETQEETFISLRKSFPPERKWILRYLETSSRSSSYTPEGHGAEEEEERGSLLRPLSLCGGGGSSSSTSSSHFLSRFRFLPSSSSSFFLFFSSSSPCLFSSTYLLLQ